MKISSTQARILRAAQFNADLPVTKLARLLRLKTHVVNYSLHRLHKEGVIRQGACIDLHALGFTEFCFYFSLASSNTRTRKAFLRYLSTHPLVYWYAELGGNYQYGASIAVREMVDTLTFLNGIHKRFGNIVMKRENTQVLSFEQYAKEYLSDSIPKSCKSHLRTSIQTPQHSDRFDELDLRIISQIVSSEFKSNDDAALRIGIPRSTFEYRLKALVNAEIIKARVYYINALKLERQRYKIQIIAPSQSSQCYKTIANFCLAQPDVVSFMQCLGRWDFEINVEAHSQDHVTKLTHALYDRLGEDIYDVQIVPVLSQGTSTAFLTKCTLQSAA